MKIKSFKELGICDTGVIGIKPPKCKCCGDITGGCSVFIFNSDEQIFNSMEMILEEIESEHCLGLTFKNNGQVLIADKLLETFKVTDTQELIPRLKHLVITLSTEYILVFIENEANSFKVLYNTINTEILHFKNLN